MPYTPTTTSHEVKQKTHRQIAMQTRLVTPHYKQEEDQARLAVVLPGEFCMDTILTMRASYPELTPTRIVFVEREKDIYQRISNIAPIVVSEVFRNANVAVDVRHATLREVFSTWPKKRNVSYIDADICGLPNAYGENDTSIGTEIASFVQTRARRDVIVQGTFFRFGLRRGQEMRYAHAIAKAAAKDGSAFLFRQMYGRKGHQHQLMRFAAASWHYAAGSRVVSVEPKDRCTDADGNPYIADTHETVPFPIAPTKREITNRALQFAPRNQYATPFATCDVY